MSPHLALASPRAPTPRPLLPRLRPASPFLVSLGPWPCLAPHPVSPTPRRPVSPGFASPRVPVAPLPSRLSCWGAAGWGREDSVPKFLQPTAEAVEAFGLFSGSCFQIGVRGTRRPYFHLYRNQAHVRLSESTLIRPILSECPVLITFDLTFSHQRNSRAVDPLFLVLH